MNFNFTPEQQQFSDALRRWIEKDYSFTRRKAIIDSKAGVSQSAWSALAELGVTAVALPESAGGLGGSTMDNFILMMELGRGLVIEPCIATAITAEFLRLDGRHDTVLNRVAEGSIRLASALSERQSRHELFNVATVASRIDGGFQLAGVKTVVIHGAQAQYLVVSARSYGDQRATDGISLFLVPLDAPGISVRDYRCIDGQRAADIELKNVRVAESALLATAGKGWPLLEAAIDHGLVMLCGEAVGAMEAMNEQTLEYLKTRQQFGVPIGKFQVLQHRMVDMAIHLAQARALATLAAATLSQPVHAAERSRVASAAKVRVGQAIKFNTQQAIQLHGGIGLMDELPLSHYVKRLTLIELALGDTDHHLARFTAQPAFFPDGVAVEACL